MHPLWFAPIWVQSCVNWTEGHSLWDTTVYIIYTYMDTLLYSLQFAYLKGTQVWSCAGNVFIAFTVSSKTTRLELPSLCIEIAKAQQFEQFEQSARMAQAGISARQRRYMIYDWPEKNLIKSIMNCLRNYHTHALAHTRKMIVGRAT